MHIIVNRTNFDAVKIMETQRGRHHAHHKKRPYIETSISTFITITNI